MTEKRKGGKRKEKKERKSDGIEKPAPLCAEVRFGALRARAGPHPAAAGQSRAPCRWRNNSALWRLPRPGSASAPRRAAPPDGPVRADPGGTALSAWETSKGTKKEEEGATRGFPARTLGREEERQAGTDGTRAAPPPLPGLQRGCVPKPSSHDSGCRSDLLASPRGPVPQPAQGEQRLHRLQKKPAVQALVAPLRSHVHSGEQAALPSGRNFAFLSSVSTPEPG